jgi:hypothetical protein
LKSIYPKNEEETLFVQNFSAKPEIVLVFPITRDTKSSSEKWKEVLYFVEKSGISTLLVIDKTDLGSATKYFMSNFEFDDKQLIVLPRSIKDTLFDTVGEISLDKNFWIIQLHDDDKWSGKLTLPESVNSETIYYSDFYLNSESQGLIQIKDFSMPNRIVFSLVPSNIWNKFASLVRAQRYHVAGSFDFTFNFMAQKMCNFEHNPGFAYHWKDDNWDTVKKSKAHLSRLANSDGWEEWSSPEIAILNRTIDSLASLSFLQDQTSPQVLRNEIQLLVLTLQPSKKNQIKLTISIPILRVLDLFGSFSLGRIFWKKSKTSQIRGRLELYSFIEKTWSIRNLADVLTLVSYLKNMQKFQSLQIRFSFWEKAIRDLQDKT